MTDLISQLRDARITRGLTQAAVAEAMGTTQSAVARLEGGGASPRLSTLESYGGVVGHRLELGSPEPLAGASSAVASALAREDPDAALRALIQFVDDATLVSDLGAALRREPASTGDRRWDAAIAAAVAWVARARGVAPPAWTAAPSKYLDGPWFPVADVLGRPVSAALAAYLLSVAPADFFGRGVIIDPSTLESV